MVIKKLALLAIVLASGSTMAQVSTTANPNSSAGSVSSFDSHNIYEGSPKVTSSAFAPSLTAGFDTCMGSTTGAVSTAVIGIALGSTYTDVSCQTIKNARELWNMGQRGAALARMCMDKLNREAMETSGFDCSKEGFNKLMKPTVQETVPTVVEPTVQPTVQPTQAAPERMTVVIREIRYLPLVTTPTKPVHKTKVCQPNKVDVNKLALCLDKSK